jgi:glyoxylase-like metal-dependent hydrolase (beta-lactamase superfamily II)
VWDFGQLQWSYLKYEGLEGLPAAIDVVRQQKPDLLCPSHGQVMTDPRSALDELESRARRAAALVVQPNVGRWNWSDLVHVSTHLFKVAGGTSYIITTDDGHALFFDLGNFKPELFQTLRERYGITHVDAVVISHFHWDHTGGIPELVKEFGSQVWALDAERDILEHPENYLMSFANNGVPPIVADRYFHDGESLDWRGHTLTFMQLPAHTEYHLGMLATVDGKPTLFTADAVGHTADNQMISSYVCGNRIFLSRGAVMTARQVARYAPYVVCPAHSDPYVALPAMRRHYVDWALETQDAIRGLIARPSAEMGFDPYWVRVEPYLVRAKPGGEVSCRVVVRNHLSQPAPVSVSLKVPEGVIATPAELSGRVEGDAEGSFGFTLACDEGMKPGRRVLGVDVTFADRHYGELTEAIIEVGE